MANPAPKRRSSVIQLIACWPGDDHAFPMYDGAQVVLPPRDQVADPSEAGSVFRFASAKDSRGEYVPGTVLLETDIRPDPVTTGMRVEFDAIAWTDGLFGVHGQPGTGQGKALAARGFAVVDTVDDAIEWITGAGRQMWEKTQKLEWERVLKAEISRQNTFTSKGQDAPPAANESQIQAASEGLIAMKAKAATAMLSVNDIKRVLGGGVPVAAPKPVAPVVTRAEEPAEDDTLGQVAELLVDAAEKNGVNLLKAELTGLIKQDGEVMEQVIRKLQAAGIDYMTGNKAEAVAAP